jgi:hypothetical protein
LLTILAAQLHPLQASDEDFKSRVEGNMEFQTKIRMQVIMVGLGAALLMAGSARAQQDMDPTYFDVNPGAPAVSHNVVVRTAQNPQAVVENAQGQAVVAHGDSTLESVMTRIAIVDASIAVILFGGVLAIVLYAMAATRRERGLQVSPRSAPYTPVSAATAQ